MRGRQQRALVGLVVAAVAAGLGWWMGTSTADPPGGSTATQSATDVGVVAYADLPPEAHETLDRIEAGGPFPYEQDGDTFFNRERLLPDRQERYYREYTVETPGSDDRGPRRIVTGSDGEAYYTDDHYRSFARVER